MSFPILYKKDLMEQMRSKKILILIIAFLFVAISSVILAKVLPQILKNIPATPGLTINLPTPTYKDAVDQFVKNISQLIIFVLVFLVAGAIADEKIKKTLEIVLTKPISKISFVLSKFTSYFTSIIIVYYASAFIFYFYTITTFQSFDFGNFILMATLALVRLLVVVSLTILFSSFASSAILAGVGGLVGMILLETVWGLIKSVKAYSPNMLMSEYQNIVANGWNHNLLIPLLISLFMIAIFIMSAIFIFKKQEIER